MATQVSSLARALEELRQSVSLLHDKLDRLPVAPPSAATPVPGPTAVTEPKPSTIDEALGDYNRGLAPGRDSDFVAKYRAQSVTVTAGSRPGISTKVGEAVHLAGSPSGTLWLIQLGSQSLLLPRYHVSRYDVAEFESCYTADAVPGDPSNQQFVQRVVKPALCRADETGWLLTESGHLVVRASSVARAAVSPAETTGGAS